MGKMKEEYIRIMNDKIASGEIDARDLKEHYFEQEIEISKEENEDIQD